MIATEAEVTMKRGNTTQETKTKITMERKCMMINTNKIMKKRGKSHMYQSKHHLSINLSKRMKLLNTKMIRMNREKREDTLIREEVAEEEEAEAEADLISTMIAKVTTRKLIKRSIMMTAIDSLRAAKAIQAQLRVKRQSSQSPTGK